MMRSTDPASSGSSSTGGALRGVERDLARAGEITAVLNSYPMEKRLFASQLDRAVDELVGGFNSIPLEPLLARQGVFEFARPALHDDWVYFTSAFLDLRAKFSAVAAMSSSTSAFSDAPPAYHPNAPSADEKDPMFGLDPLTAKVARLLSTRSAYDTAKSHFLLLQHSQSAPGFTWVPTDFTPARDISSSGTVMNEIARKMTDMSLWYKARLPLAESAYRLVAPEPSFSMSVLEGIKMEKPIECASQSSWLLQMGALTATFELVRSVLGGEASLQVRSERTRQALGYLASLEINWVGAFMGENPADRARNRRIRMSNELVSLRLALLQAVSEGDGPRMDLLNI